MTNILHLQPSFVFNKFPSHLLKVQVSTAASSEKQINGFSSIRDRQNSWRGSFMCPIGIPSPGSQAAWQTSHRARTNTEMGISGVNSASFYEPVSHSIPVKPLSTAELTSGRSCAASSPSDWWEPWAIKIPENETSGFMLFYILFSGDFLKWKHYLINSSATTILEKIFGLLKIMWYVRQCLVRIK